MTMIPLIEVLEKIEDKRSNHGRRYNLVSVLSACIAAILCGCTSYSAIAEWCKNYSNELLKKLGFMNKKPCAATFHNVLKGIDVIDLEKKLGQWFQINFLKDEEAIAIDGKSLRGSKGQGSELYHLLSAVSSRLGITAYQVNVGEKTGEIKGFEEILKGIILEGKILTMDALLTQRKIAEKIIRSNADYVMIAKDNQEYIKEDIENLLIFKENIREISSFQTIDKGHGRIEIRKIILSDSEDYIDWPGVKQVFCIERNIFYKDKNSYQKVYGLTSLSPEKADANKILTLVREHWSVENKSHWIRDAVYNEDKSQVRTGFIPEVMANFRNIAIGLIKASNWNSVAKANRFFAANPSKSLDLIFQIIK